MNIEHTDPNWKASIIWRDDWLNMANYYGMANYYTPEGEYRFDLLVTSTPYPQQRGFKLTPEEYLEWLRERIGASLPLMNQKTGVIALNIRFRRRDDGRFDSRVYDVARTLEDLGLYFIDEYIWDQMNPPPRGNMARTDAPAYERVFVFGLSPDYYFDPQFGEYSEKTVRKNATGNPRGRDIAGNMGGGHALTNPQGARLNNVIRASSSGDQEPTATGQARPRVMGGVFPRELARRLIRQYSPPGGWIIDPCLGSGTSLWVAAEQGRNGVGIDVSPEACQTAHNWIAEDWSPPEYFAALRNPENAGFFTDKGGRVAFMSTDSTRGVRSVIAPGDQGDPVVMTMLL